MPLYCLCTSKIVCKTLDGASNATKMAQIDKGLNKICILQMNGVMGMMWVATYDQFTFWSLRCLDVTLFFQRFFKALDGVFHATKKCSNWWRFEQDIHFPSEGDHEDVGWHIWPICILELKIFGCHSIYLCTSKRFIKLQITFP